MEESNNDRLDPALKHLAKQFLFPNGTAKDITAAWFVLKIDDNLKAILNKREGMPTSDFHLTCLVMIDI